MLINFKSQKGYTGIDIAISIIILFAFTIIISTIFVNIYMQYTESQRNSTAMSYLTSISELIDKMYYQDVYTEQTNDEESLENRINELFGTSITNINNTNRNQKLEFTISNSYIIKITISNYNPEGEDLVKNIEIEVSYTVNNTNKSLKVSRIKAKEILITPNRPQLSSNMIPVKFIITNIATGEGYWQVTSENDTTWYNYENKVWAYTMLKNGLIVEDGISLTDENKSSLIGKRITNITQIFAWIPRFVLSNNDTIFLYSNSDKFVNSNRNLENKNPNAIVSNAFNGITGFWIAKEDYNYVNTGITQSQKDAVLALTQSKYGKDEQEFKNISNNRKVIVTR